MNKCNLILILLMAVHMISAQDADMDGYDVCPLIDPDILTLSSGDIAFIEFKIPEYSSLYFFDQAFDPNPDDHTLSQNIENKYYQVNHSITTAGITTILDTTTFIAGGHISLNQNFSVDQGKVFETHIGDCKN